MEFLALKYFFHSWQVQQSSQCRQICQSIHVFHNMVQRNMTSASAKGDLQSLPPTREGYKTTHLVEPQDIRRSDFFLWNDYSKSFEYHRVLLVRFLRNKIVKLASTTFCADTSLEKYIHRFSLLCFNTDHQNSISWLRVEEP